VQLSVWTYSQTLTYTSPLGIFVVPKKICPQYPPAPSTLTEFFPLCAVDESSVILPPWLQSGAYVGHAVASNPFSNVSLTCAKAAGASAARARRAVFPNMFAGIVSSGRADLQVRRLLVFIWYSSRTTNVWMLRVHCGVIPRLYIGGSRPTIQIAYIKRRQIAGDRLNIAATYIARKSHLTGLALLVPAISACDCFRCRRGDGSRLELARDGVVSLKIVRRSGCRVVNRVFASARNKLSPARPSLKPHPISPCYPTPYVQHK
jgi:hypothetical protein